MYRKAAEKGLREVVFHYADVRLYRGRGRLPRNVLYGDCEKGGRGVSFYKPLDGAFYAQVHARAERRYMARGRVQLRHRKGRRVAQRTYLNSGGIKYGAADAKIFV